MLKVRMETVAGVDLGEKSFSEFPLVIGREPDCALVLGEGGISGRHVELNWDGEWLSVRDLGSRNGTFVGKEKVSEVKLELPAVITVGNVVLLHLELEEAITALSPRPMSLPKPLKRPEPPVPVHTESPELVAKVVEVEEAVVIEGWELYWHKVKDQNPRPVLLAMMGLGVIYGFLHLIVFREGFLFSLGVGMGAAIASAIFAIITAGIFAVPGILFRGKYDFKPLYIQQCVGTMVLTFYAGILRPAFLMSYFGYLAQGISILLIAACSIAGCYMFFFNTFSHKYERRLMIISMIVALIAIAGEARKVFSVERQELMQEALMGKYRTARGLAGSTTNVNAISEDLKAFGRKFPVK